MRARVIFECYVYVTDVVFAASNYTALKLLLWCKQSPVDSVKVSFSWAVAAVAKCAREPLVILWSLSS